MAGTNADNPDLSGWTIGFKSSAGNYFTLLDFNSSRFEIE
jgi:hypothetical protein